MSAIPNRFDPNLIALIGFGEAGGLFAEGFSGNKLHRLMTYDLKLDDEQAAPALRAKAARFGVEAAPSAEFAMRSAGIVISAVTATSAPDVARQAGEFMGPGQFFVDINSVSPATKRGDAELAERGGADFVEAAVMAPVYPLGIKVPILLGGAQAEALKALLDSEGMNLKVADHAVGKASAIKMCRSVMIKGLEALMTESMLAARLYGVEDRILASLTQTYPGIDWEEQAGYLIMRVVEHGRRRAAEMREVTETIADVGFEPLMAPATALRQDWLADISATHPELKKQPEADWRATLDAIAGIVGAKKPAGI